MLITFYCIITIADASVNDFNIPNNAYNILT